MQTRAAIAEAMHLLRAKKIGVMPTDTLYGFVGSALSRAVVERIYRVRQRNSRKPMIILVARMGDLRRFGVRLDARMKRFLRTVWSFGSAQDKPVSAQRSRKASAGAVSVILPCRSPKFRYLHRGTKTLAFRVPKPLWLRRLLQRTGPLVAPSANPEGKPPARTVGAARRYFGDRVDFYAGGSARRAQPSILIEIKR